MANELCKLAKERGQGELADDIPDMLALLGRGVFRLVVMGEIKKGKSSFLNALLGIGNLLPTNVDVATSTVYKIIHGPEKKVKVFFLPDPQTGRLMEPLEISESQVAEYGTEDGNPGNRKQVDFIAVELPSDLLATGLAIVDTPGVGGLYKSHRGITWRYAPNADAVFFVLDSTESVISQDEIDFLRELTEKITQRVYFIQTKTDLAGREQWMSWETRNKEILAKELPDMAGEYLRYFPVSSKLKQDGGRLKKDRLVEDSGFPAVENFLRDELIAAKDFYLCQAIAKPLLAKSGLLRAAFDSEARAAQTGAGQALDVLKKDLESRQQALSSWERTIFPSRQQEFSDSFRDLRQKACEDLQNVLDPQSSQLTMLLDQLRQQPKITAAVLDSKIRDIQSDLIATCSERGHAIIRDFVREVDRELSRFCREVATHIPENQLVARSGTVDLGSWAEGVSAQQSLHLSHSGFETGRSMLSSAMMGFSVGAIVANIGLTMASIAVGGIPLIVGPIVAVLFAGGAADAAKKRHLEEALSKTERVIRETVMSVRNKALNDFNRLASDRERAIRDLFQAAIKGTHGQYEREIAQIRELENQTQEALRKTASERSVVLKTLNDHAVQLQSIIRGSVSM